MAHNLIDADAQEQGGRIEHNRFTVFEDNRYAYDAHGDLSSKKVGRHTEIALQWNGEHQLVKTITKRQAHTLNPTIQTVSYGYDPFGLRLYKQDAFGITHFVWHGNRLLEEVRQPCEYVCVPAGVLSAAGAGQHCKWGIEKSEMFIH